MIPIIPINEEIIHDVRLGNELKKLVEMQHIQVSPQIMNEIREVGDDELVWIGFDISDKLNIKEIEVVDTDFFRNHLFEKTTTETTYTGRSPTTL